MIKRTAWTTLQLDAPKYRKHIMEGTEWVIEGWADLEQRQGFFTVIIVLPSGANQSITKETYTRNLKLTREYQDIKGAHADLGEEQKTRPGSSSSAKADPSQRSEWAVGKSDASLVKSLLSIPCWQILTLTSSSCTSGLASG